MSHHSHRFPVVLGGVQTCVPLLEMIALACERGQCQQNWLGLDSFDVRLMIIRRRSKQQSTIKLVGLGCLWSVAEARQGKGRKKGTEMSLICHALIAVSYRLQLAAGEGRHF